MVRQTAYLELHRTGRLFKFLQSLLEPVNVLYGGYPWIYICVVCFSNAGQNIRAGTRHRTEKLLIPYCTLISDLFFEVKRSLHNRVGNKYILGLPGLLLCKINAQLQLRDSWTSSKVTKSACSRNMRAVFYDIPKRTPKQVSLFKSRFQMSPHFHVNSPASRGQNDKQTAAALPSS